MLICWFQVEYKEYTLKDYRKIKKEVKLGSLGPDVESQDMKDRVRTKFDYKLNMWFLLKHKAQGWKLQTVCLSGTGKNGAGQVKILDAFPKERLKLWK